MASELSCVILHHSPEYAEQAAQLISKQWNHQESELPRYLEGMCQQSKDTLPCHLALVLTRLETISSTSAENATLLNHLNTMEPGETLVVGHVKLTRAAGRSDGACCISYSLVVDERFRNCGLGRKLTEEAENYARSLELSYMYLSTDDKVEFYEHIGYKQCEPVSSLGKNSTRLTASQVSYLEGLFAQRLKVLAPGERNTWLRKRLIGEYPMQEAYQISDVVEVLSEKLSDLLYHTEEYTASQAYVGFILKISWQQQTGPSCGISVLNMLNSTIRESRTGVLKEPSIPLCEDCTPNGNKEDEEQLQSLSPLTYAIKSGVSNDGELFCAHNLAYVAKNALGIDLTVKELADVNEISHSILQGHPVLIPYDRNVGDHGPTNAGGHQAHWAVIIGFIVSNEEDKNYDMKEYTDDVKEFVKRGLPDLDSKFCLMDATQSLPDNNKLEELTNEEVFLVCMHGMSNKPFICSFVNMAKSNGQLHESKSKFYMASEDLNHLRGKLLYLTTSK